MFWNSNPKFGAVPSVLWEILISTSCWFARRDDCALLPSLPGSGKDYGYSNLTALWSTTTKKKFIKFLKHIVKRSGHGACKMSYKFLSHTNALYGVHYLSCAALGEASPHTWSLLRCEQRKCFRKLKCTETSAHNVLKGLNHTVWGEIQGTSAQLRMADTWITPGGLCWKVSLPVAGLELDGLCNPFCDSVFLWLQLQNSNRSLLYLNLFCIQLQFKKILKKN